MTLQAQDIAIRLVGDGGRLSATLSEGQRDLARFASTASASMGQAAVQTNLAHLAMQKAARQTQYQNIQLAYQLNDFGVQVASGQSPFIALIQQGSQLAGVYGSVGAAARAVAAAVFSTTGLLAAGALGLVGLAVAAVRADEAAAALARSLALTGNAAGQTASSVAAMSASVAESVGTSERRARDLVEALVATGSVGPGALGAVAEAAGRLQRLSGQSTEDVVRQFSTMRRGVAEWAAEANRSYNFLTLAQYRQLRALEETQGREAAAVEAMRLFNGALQSRGVAVGAFSGQLFELGRMLGWVRDQFDAWLRPDTLVERIDAQRLALDRLQAKLAEVGQAGTGFGNRQLAVDLRAQVERTRQNIANLQEQQRLETRSAAQSAERASTEQQAIAAEQEQQRAGAQGAAERLRQSQEALATERDRLAALRVQVGLGAQILALRRQGEAGADRAGMASYVQERVAALELRQIDAERVPLAQALARARAAEAAASTPEQTVAAQQQVVRLQQELLRLSERRAQVDDGQARAQAEGARAQAQSVQASVQASAALTEQSDAARRALLDLAAARELELAGLQQTEAQRQQDTAQRELSRALTALERGLQQQYAAGLLTEAAYQAQLAQARGLADRALRASNAALAQASTRQSSWVQGMTDAMDAYGQQAARMGDATREATTRVLGSVEDAFTELLTKGKTDTRALIDAIVSEYMRLALVRPIINSMLGVGGGSAGGGGLLGGLVQGAFDLIGSFIIPDFAFAKGAAIQRGSVVQTPTLLPMAGGKTAVMGEAGAEAVMPLSRGPDGRLGVVAQGAGGGGTVVYETHTYHFGNGVSRAEVFAGMEQARAAAVSDVRENRYRRAD